MSGCTPWLALIALVTVTSCGLIGGGPPAVRFTGEEAQLQAHFKGFQRDAVPDGWQVRDGAITRVGGGGDLVTREVFRDFDLTLQWRISPEGNSGIIFHVSEDPQWKATYETGPEMQVLDTKGYFAKAGKPVQLNIAAGANYALHAPERDATRPVGEWNDVRIEVLAGRVRQWLNGELQCDYVLGSSDWNARVAASKFNAMPGYGIQGEGVIAFQDHGNEVAYRDITIRRL